MTGTTDFSAVVRDVLHRDRIGHRLLLAYYAVSAIVVIVTCAVQPAYAGITICAGFVIGVLLLADVAVSNRRARRPLLARRPDLGEVATSRTVQPHSIATAVFFVVALLLICAAGGIARLAAGTGEGSAGGRDGFIVTLSTLLVICVPLMTYAYITYLRRARGPYLAGLEHALALADEGVGEAAWLPAGSPARTPFRGHMRRRDYIWAGLIFLILAGRAGLLVALIVEGAIGGGAATAAASNPGFPGSPFPSGPSYPPATLAHGVVTDTRAGIAYTAPPGTGWTQDTSPMYPAEGSEFTKTAPGQSGDEADIVSAPLPSGISYTGASDLQDATASYAGNILGTWFSAHTDTVLANHGLSVCGRHGWLAEVKVHYTKEKLPDEIVALAVVDLSSGRRPGTLIADIPDTMDPGLPGKLTQSVRPVTGCPAS